MNAIRTLRHMGHRDRDELLGLRRQGAVGKDPLAEGSEGAVDLGRQLPSFLRELLGRVRVDVMIHGKRSFQIGISSSRRRTRSRASLMIEVLCGSKRRPQAARVAKAG